MAHTATYCKLYGPFICQARRMPAPGPLGRLVLGAQVGEQRGPVRRAEAGAGIPAGTRLVGAVVALHDVVEARGGGPRRNPGVDQRLEQAELLPGGLREPGDKT